MTTFLEVSRTIPGYPLENFLEVKDLEWNPLSIVRRTIGSYLILEVEKSG